MELSKQHLNRIHLSRKPTPTRTQKMNSAR
jgi:hypothetical protein